MSPSLDPRLLHASPTARRLAAAFTAVHGAAAALVVAQAIVLSTVVAALVGDPGAVTGLGPRLAALVAIGLGRAALAGTQEWLGARASTRVRAELRRSVLAAVRLLGPQWAARQPAGRLVTAAGPGLESIDGFVTRALPALIAAVVVPPVVLAAAVLVDWRGGLILVVLLPLAPAFLGLVGVTTGRRMQRQYATLARLSGHFLDLVTGLTSLRIYGRADAQVATVRRATDTYRRHTMATLRTAFLSGLVLDLVATLSVAVVAVDVGLRLDHGSMALAPAFTVLLLAPELFAPLRALGAVHHASEEGRTAAAAALDIVAEAAARRDQTDAGAGSGAGGTVPAPHDGIVRLRAVTVSYPDRPRPALDGVDLELGPHEITVLTGSSGAGKSTLLATVLGFVRPASGTVTVGSAERALSDVDPADWRAGVAWVPQRPRPTQSTAGAEVALGDPAAPQHEIDEALYACAAPPAGTPLGEDGRSVSAGQKRRIALARALLRARRLRAAGRVPIVVLDEPSEDLDRATEAVVASVLDSLRPYATVLVASHSTRLARIADRIVEIADGRVHADRHQTPVRVAATAPLAAGTPEAVRSPAPTPPRPVGVLPRTRTAVLVAGAGLLNGAAGLAGLALTATSIWLICRAAEHPNVQALAIAVVGVRTFALARAGLRYLERLTAHDGALRLLADVRSHVFAALVPLVPSALDVRRGDLLRRFATDVDGIQEGLVRAAVPTAGAALTAVGAVTLAALITPVAGAALAGALLVALLVVPALARIAAGSATRAAELSGRRDAGVTGLLDGLAELTAYGADGRAADEVDTADRALSHDARRVALAAGTGTALSGAAAAVALPAVLAAAAAAARNGTVSGPLAAVVVACVLAGFDAVTGIPAAHAAWSRHRAGFHRVQQVLAAGPPVPDPDRPAVLTTAPAHLRAAALAVAPAAGAPDAVRGADLDLRPGRRIAVTGPSGCGKSTLLAAALRLLPVRAGRLDLVQSSSPTPLADVAPVDLPPRVAGSLQGDHVFDATLRDNLRVVRPAASDTELDAVAARVGLDGLLAELPERWSTPAGADGTMLSGGQRQRLLLARALLADPDVLVLDEPTAHLDPATERTVLRDLLGATRGRTVLLSSHRLLPDTAVDAVVDLGGDPAAGAGGVEGEVSRSHRCDLAPTEVPA